MAVFLPVMEFGTFLALINFQLVVSITNNSSTCPLGALHRTGGERQIRFMIFGMEIFKEISHGFLGKLLTY